VCRKRGTRGCDAHRNCAENRSRLVSKSLVHIDAGHAGLSGPTSLRFSCDAHRNCAENRSRLVSKSLVHIDARIVTAWPWMGVVQLVPTPTTDCVAARRHHLNYHAATLS
jgi:hypothetical protein